MAKQPIVTGPVCLKIRPQSDAGGGSWQELGEAGDELYSIDRQISNRPVICSSSGDVPRDAIFRGVWYIVTASLACWDRNTVNAWLHAVPTEGSPVNGAEGSVGLLWGRSGYAFELGLFPILTLNSTTDHNPIIFFNARPDDGDSVTERGWGNEQNTLLLRFVCVQDRTGQIWDYENPAPGGGGIGGIGGGG